MRAFALKVPHDDLMHGFVLPNCKVDVISLLEGLPWRSLILFDLGYFSFAWFDYLTSMGYWWISRLREKTRWRRSTCSL